MTLALAGAGLVLFSTYGALMLWSERRDLQTAIRHEMNLLSQSMRVSVESALRDRQVADIQQTLRRLERVDPALDIWVYGPDGHLVSSSAGSLPPAYRPDDYRARTRSLPQSTSFFDPASDPERLVSSIPLALPDQTATGRLIIVRGLSDMRRDLAATRRGITLSVGAFVVLTLVLGSTLGHVYITRPLGAVADALGRVRRGELDDDLQLPARGTDEAAVLSRDFNSMVSALRDARARLKTEADSRRRMQRELQQVDKLVTIGQLSAGLAHEVGSPLQVLNGRARLLVSHPDDPEVVRQNARSIVEQSARITRIVEQLLQYTRRRPRRLDRVHPGDAIREVLDFLEVEARRRGLDVRLEEASGTPTLRCDADQLQQIVLNLVTNAFRSTPPGGIVSVTVAPGERPDGRADTVTIVVSDTGAGIPPEAQPHIFEPFFTTRADEGGAGLGLAVVKGIVTEHRGVVSFTSEVGRGTRFIVELPLDPAADIVPTGTA